MVEAEPCAHQGTVNVRGRCPGTAAVAIQYKPEWGHVKICLVHMEIARRHEPNLTVRSLAEVSADA